MSILTPHPDATKAETKGTFRFVSDDIMGPTSGFYLSKVWVALNAPEAKDVPVQDLELEIDVKVRVKTRV